MNDAFDSRLIGVFSAKESLCDSSGFFQGASSLIRNSISYKTAKHAALTDRNSHFHEMNQLVLSTQQASGLENN